jgi:deoxycytidylate deaminase
MLYYLRLASKVANVSIDTCRKAFIGCIAVRKDGAIVSSRNSATRNPTGPAPVSHAERKVLKKSGYGATLYVARVRRDGSIGCAKPCARCRASMRSMGVERVYYTISPDEWAWLKP